MGNHPRAPRWRRRLLFAALAGLALYAIAGIPLDQWRGLLPSGPSAGRTQVVVRGFDTVAMTRQEILLRAKVQKVDPLGLYPAVSGVRVLFKLDDDVVAQARTAVDGCASADWLPPSASDFTLSACVDPESSFAGEAATLFVGVYDPDDRFIAVDFDGTLTKSSGLALPFEGPKSAMPQPQAAVALTEIAKSFHVLYVTSRDDRSMETVKTWLRANGFPLGATFFRDFELIESPAEEFRFHELRRLRSLFPHIQYGVGDDAADASAYARAGLSPILLGSSASSSLPTNTRIAPTWLDVESAILER
ncbi:MAG: hypothetical protein HYR85_01995 [Planctomycetes bacterium]|nr:hypothetical protein [Planctomycetota bacterium]MBI3845712.1 hypothetical protein [Planctomycetota bacterium]